MRSRKSKIISPESLARKLARRRTKSDKVVFTNGCFDLIHKGHVSYLEAARRLGETLVVALNTDASVRRSKGPARPLNPLADRLEVMAALEAVDYVTWFSADTPLALIQKLNPDVLVKGGDWKPDQIVGSEHVLARGGLVKSLSFVQGRSTTGLIRRARNS